MSLASRSGGADTALGPRTGAVLLLVVAAAAAVVVAGRRTRPPPPPSPPPAVFPTRLKPETLSEAEAARPVPDLVSGYRRAVPRPPPTRSIPTPPPQSPALMQPEPPGAAPKARGRDGKSVLPEIVRMPADPRSSHGSPEATASNPAGSLPTESPRAPFGRLLKCVLVSTIDSITSRSEPIIAMATEDLDWNGAVIIPATTEVLGYALPGAILGESGSGRLIDSGQWILVLPGIGGANGRELELKGRALDRTEARVDPDGSSLSWGLNDGAAGLIGTTVSTIGSQDTQLFAAAAASGLAQGLSEITQRQQAAAGISGLLGATQPSPDVTTTVTRAAGDGGVALLGQVAQRLQQELAKRGTYVRVPASKQFYLYIEESIDLSKAKVGLRQTPSPRSPSLRSSP